ERLRQMLAEPWAHPRARHGVPLIADAAGVQPQRPRRRGLGPQRRYFRRDEAGLEIAGEEAAFGEEPRLRLGALADRPLHRRHRVEIAVRQRGQRADVEVARALVFECRERGVLTENIRRRVEAEGSAEAEAPG